MGRAPCCDKANVKRGPWSPEEDTKLKEYIEKHGTGGNWIALPQKAGLKRCGKSCRLRWLNYLRPNIKHGEFSEEEDRIICSLYVNIGSRWSIIAAQLPGRTDNDIKNYWNTKLKKKLVGLLPPHHQSHQKIIKPQTFPSSNHQNQNHNQNQPQHKSPSSSMYIDYFGSYNDYYTPETTTSFNTLDPIISSLLPTQSDYAIGNTISSQPFYQNQDQPIMDNVGVNYYNNNMQYNNYYHFNMVGSEGGSCSTSSDGSCGHGKEIIKQEEICGYNNSTNNNQSYINMCSYNDIMNDCGENIIVNQLGQSQTEQVQALEDYDVEDIKQLISVSSSRFNNNNIDEIKGEDHENEEAEKKKSMYYYYYY